ncbi:hypothetical protein ACTMSW_01365 [Micromonospora sp. BQ11]|uniref:hypothetical protein n=1 Tax=Micromonospora sp. BQ11 TaxID=3452212 RepID=UPI003F8B4555
MNAAGGLLALAGLREIVVELWARTGRHSGLPRYVEAYGHWLHARGRDRMFVGGQEPERAEWLARKVGLTVLGF